MNEPDFKMRFLKNFCPSLLFNKKMFLNDGCMSPQVSAQQVCSLPRRAAVRLRQRPFQQQQLPVHPPLHPHQPVGEQRPRQSPQLLGVRERISEFVGLISHDLSLSFRRLLLVTGAFSPHVSQPLWPFCGVRLASRTWRRTSRVARRPVVSCPPTENPCATPARGQRGEVTAWGSLTEPPPKTPRTQPSVSSHRSG